MKSYKELIVWQKSVDLVAEVYLVTSKFPKSELFGIVSQMRRAVISIPSNIAEGYGRKSKLERGQFYLIAFSSGLELETQVIISKRLGFINDSEYLKAEGLLDEILRMLNKLTEMSRSNI